MTMARIGRWLAIMAVLAAGLGACGGDDDDAGDRAGDGTATSAPAGDGDGSSGTTSSDDDGGDGDDDGGDGDDGAGGTMRLGDEDIVLMGSMCYWEPQDAAGGGGEILWVVQSRGVTGEPQPILIDVSRYSEDSQFAGDSVSVTVGTPGDPDEITYSGILPTGTVTDVEGESASAEGVTLLSEDDGSEVSVSFDLAC